MTEHTDDFSHLPTVDSAGGGGVDRRRLWRQSRPRPEGRIDTDDGATTNWGAGLADADTAHEHTGEVQDGPGDQAVNHDPAEDRAPAPSGADAGSDDLETRDDFDHEAEAGGESWVAGDLPRANERTAVDGTSAIPGAEAEADASANAALEPAPADNTEELKRSARRALITTVLLHIAVILTLGLTHTVVMERTPAEIVAVAAVDQQEAPAWKKITTATPQAAPMPSVSPMLATAASDFAIPAPEFDTTASQLNLGSSFGSFGMGTGAGAGSKVSFLGNTASGNNIVYVVDLSSSMLARSRVEGSENSVSRFELLQKELRSSIGRLSSAVQYQILFFADFAIAHDETDTKDYSKLQKVDWKIRAGQRDVKIPRFQYLQGSRVNIARSQRIIDECTTFGGTNWGSGLRMALNGNPKPDVIFFMTDGDAGDEQGWVSDITENNSRGKRTIIHTTAMMVPGAADALADIARRNGGQFTIVMPNGKVLTGDQFFKQRTP